jgi:hypothetical protein
VRALNFLFAWRWHGSTVRQWLAIACGAWLVSALTGCTGRAFDFSVYSVYSDLNAQPSGRLPFRTGQIVLSEAPGPYGILFTLAPSQFFRFTHSALIVVDQRGQTFVYDMSAEFKPSLATSPAGALRGGLRRTPLADYLAVHLYIEVYEPPVGVDESKVASKIRALEAHGVPFDAAWNFDDHRELYCSEFVVEALAAGGATRPPLIPLSSNPSLLRALRWFGIKSTEVLPAAAIPRGRRIAAFSRWQTRAAAEAYLEAKRELYRRFTPEQQIGNLLSLSGNDVQLRTSVAALLDRAPMLYGEAKELPPEVEMRARVRRLADELLGPFVDAVGNGGE